MPSTYTTNNGIELIGTGEQSGTWGDTTNTNLTLVDASLDGHTTVTLVSAGTSGSPNSLPITDGAASNGRNRALIFTDGGDLGASVYVQLTPSDAKKIMFVRNSLSGSRNLILFQGTYNASNDFVLAAGKDAIVKFDGAGSGAVASAVLENLALDAATITTISNTTLNTATVNATTVDTTNIEVTNVKAKDGTASATIANSTGVMTIASSVLTTTDINGGTIDGAVIGGTSPAAGTFTTANATTVDTTNIEVTTLKAKDGTAAGSIANATGVVTLASSVLTTTDINGGTIDGTVIGGSSAAAGTFTTVTASGDLTIADKIVHSGDTNTSIRFPAADTVTVETSGTERLRITSAGSVGIGTTSPTVNLDIYDATSSALTVRGDTATYMRIERSSTDTSNPGIFFTKTRGTQAAKTAVASGDATGIVSFQAFGGTNNRTTAAIRSYVDTYVSDTNLSGSLRFYTTNASTAETEVMRISPTGNVGIGTGSTTVKLNISNGATSGTAVQVATTGSGNNIDMVDATGTARVRNVNGEMRLYGDLNTGGNGNIIFHPQGATERMIITSAGNVGIGTSSPSYNLDVQGGGAQAAVRIKNTSTGGGDPDATLYLDTGNSSGESAVKFQQGGVDAGRVEFVGSDLRLYSDIGGVGFYTSATNRMFVSGAGNVGIGTTSPGTLLHLYGSATAGADTVLRVSNGNTDGAGILGFGDTGDSFIGGIQYDHADDSMNFFVNNSYRMYINSAGNVGVGYTSPARKLHVLHEDATTNTVVPAVRVARSTTGTPATGIGTGIDFVVETATGSSEIGSVFEIVSTDITPSSEDFDFVLKLMAGGAAAAEVMRVDSTGTISTPLGTSMAASFICSRADSTALQNFLIGYRAGVGTPFTGNPVALRTAGDGAGNVAALTFEIGGAIGSSEKMRLTSGGNLALGTTSPIVQLQTSSDALVGGVVYRRQPTPASFAAAGTAAIADLLLGIVRYTGAAATVTLPTGTNIEGGLPTSFPQNHSFDFSVINTGSGTVTLGTATGLTLIGGMTVTAGASGMFRVRKTGTNAYTIYRIS